MIGFTDAPGICHTIAVSSSLVPGSLSSHRVSRRFPRGHSHQSSQALRLLEQFAAGADKNDQSAIENDRLGGELEREARMLLDEQHGKLDLALQPVEPGQQGID